MLAFSLISDVEGTAVHQNFEIVHNGRRLLGDF